MASSRSTAIRWPTPTTSAARSSPSRSSTWRLAASKWRSAKATRCAASSRKSDLSRDRQEQRADRFSKGDRIDAMVTGFDKSSRKVSLSIKAMELADEKEAIAQFGSSDSGASLGDILGAA